MPFVVIKRLWLSIKIASLAAAAKKGFVDNKSQIEIVNILSVIVDRKALEDSSAPIKNSDKATIMTESKIVA